MKIFIHIFYICIISGLIYAHYSCPEIKEITVIKTVDKIIHRDYSNISSQTAIELVREYDTAKMALVYDITKQSPVSTDLSIKWKLAERRGEQEISIPIGQSGNFKLYAGIGIGAVAVGGLAYLIK